MARIKSIRRSKVEARPVYNLTVENDPTYHAGRLLVHNCRCILSFTPEGEKWETDRDQLARVISMLDPNFGGKA